MEKLTLIPRFHFAHSPFSGTRRLISAVLLPASLAATTAQAQVTQLSAPPAGASVTTTNTYPTGDSRFFINGPFTAAAGSTNVTYTATAATAGFPSFESFSNYDGSTAFPIGTQIVATFDGSKSTGPLLISFSSGVSSFSLSAEDDLPDFETYTFTVFSGSAADTFTTPAVNSTQGSGQTVFLGAQATGQLITSVWISSSSNDFYVGPLSLYTAAPVPEASTLVSLGLLLALGTGGILLRRRRLV